MAENTDIMSAERQRPRPTGTEGPEPVPTPPISTGGQPPSGEGNVSQLPPDFLRRGSMKAPEAIIDMPRREPAPLPDGSTQLPSRPAQPAPVESRTEVVREAGLTHVPEAPTTSRRTFLKMLGLGVATVTVGAAASEPKTGFLRGLFGGGKKGAPVVLPGNGGVKPETLEPATQAPTTEVPATVEPTKIPEKPVLPLVPEKYDLGEGNKYAEFYPNGLFTGVEKGRAEETNISYISPWDKSGPTFDVEQEVIKGLRVNDPAVLEKALWISEELRKSMLEKTDDNGVLTVEDFDRANTKYDALAVEGNTPLSDIRGVVIVEEPLKGLYTTQYNGFGKQKEEGFDRVTAEIFISGFKVSDRQTLFNGTVGVWCAANAQNQLDYVNESFPVTPEYTAAKLAPIAKRFQTLFAPNTFTLLS